MSQQHYKIPPRGQLVRLGDVNLHAQQMGEGDATVVFESGLGSYSDHWFQIQPLVAQHTQTISYDRVGYGWSDPSSAARTPAYLTDQLHQLLAKLHVAPPYIFVGHSFGGLLGRYYAKRYPDQVRGLVQVDTSHEMQLEVIKNYARQHKIMLASMRLISMFARVPAIGQYLAGASFQELKPHISPDLWDEMIYIIGLPKFFDAIRAEMTAFDDYFGRSHIIPTDFGDLPLTVVTAGESILHSPPRGYATSAEQNQAHIENQAAIARMSTQGQHIIIPKATHLSILANAEHAQGVSDAIIQLIKR